MDQQTLAACPNLASKENVEGTLHPDFVAKFLTESEKVLWQICVCDHLRLEQEHIPQKTATAILSGLAESRWTGTSYG
jgi:hypothetical protein